VDTRPAPEAPSLSRFEKDSSVFEPVTYLQHWLSFIDSISGLLQVHSLFQCEFCTQCDLVLPLSISSTLSFHYCHSVATYVLFLVLPSPLIFPYISFNNVWPIQLAFLPFIIYRIFPYPWLFVILLHFLLDRSIWFSPSFSSTTFQNFKGISHLLSEVPQFQHHKKLCSKCSTLLVSFSNSSPIC
jgi:hypothetical protein